jgi:hypothetical protein
MSRHEWLMVREELEILSRLLTRTWGAKQRQLLHHRAWQLLEFVQGTLKKGQ